MRKDAEQRYLTREQELQDEIKKGEMRINELQRERGGSGAGAVDANGFLVLTPEQAEELKKLEQASRDARKELREVQRSLRAEIESTGTGIMVLNVIAWPLAVAMFATGWISLRYRRQRGK
jgi:predicted RNA-binding protein with TRAM domain